MKAAERFVGPSRPRGRRLSSDKSSDAAMFSSDKQSRRLGLEANAQRPPAAVIRPREIPEVLFVHRGGQCKQFQITVSNKILEGPSRLRQQINHNAMI
jgi:hypothetical protein